MQNQVRPEYTENTKALLKPFGQLVLNKSILI